MNERILELASEAMVERASGFREFDANVFAELLIRECMDIISDESEKVSDEWRCKDGKHIWWKIKEHFGVE